MTEFRPSGIFVNDKNVLLIHRINHGRGYYVFPGGHVEKGETLEQAFIREMKEETGLNVIEYREVFRTFNIDESHKENREHVFYLVGRYEGVLSLGGEELVKMKEDKENSYYLNWYSKEEFSLLKPVFPRNVCEFILNNILK